MSETSTTLSGQGDGATTTTAAASAMTTTTAATTTQTAAPVLPWLPNADETTVGFVQNKGWKEPGEVLDGYRNLEKLLGADRAGNTVVLPKPEATPEEMGKFYERLGRPSDAAGYKIEIPKGGDPEFAKAAGSWFHELGLSEKQGHALAEKWNEHATTLQTAQTQAAQARFETDAAALKTDWGQAYTQNLNQAQAAVRGLGVTNEQIDHMAGTMGHKATMEFFQKIGARMGEGSFVTGDKTEKFSSAMTPGQAKAEIQTLRSDKDFVAKILKKDAEASTRWDQLHKYAFPEEGQ